MSPPRAYRAGESLEDFCRACKTDRVHTVVAVDADARPIRVSCGYCHSDHNYRGGPKVRNCGRLRPEAKTVGVAPQVGNFKISPSGAKFVSATNRLPELSKAKPRGLVRPVAQVLSAPLGVNFRIVSLPGAQKGSQAWSVETNRFPLLSKAKPTG